MIISASKAREKLFPLIEQVNEDQASITITSNAGNAVLVSESEWESILETALLLRTPANREKLQRSLSQLERGKGLRVKHQPGQTLNQLLEISASKKSTSKKQSPKKRASKKIAAKPKRQSKNLA
jgi:antitoxin YefM